MPRTRVPAPPGFKHCRRCRQDRANDDFSRDASKSDGLRVCCRACDGKRLKAAYWTKERKRARKVRHTQVERRKLERQHGRQWVAQQEQLKAEKEAAKKAAERHERREHASRRFWEGIRGRRESPTS